MISPKSESFSCVMVTVIVTRIPSASGNEVTFTYYPVIIHGSRAGCNYFSTEMNV